MTAIDAQGRGAGGPRLTVWVLAHKRRVLAFWVIATIAGMIATAQVGGRLDQHESVPGREGAQTNQLIQRMYGDGGAARPIVVVSTLPPGQTVDFPGVRAQLRAAFDRIAATLPGSRIASFVSTGDRGFVSADGRTTFALIEPHAGTGDQGDKVSAGALAAATASAAASRVAGGPVRLTGTQLLEADTGAKHQQGSADFGLLAETAAGALGALAVLAFVFASLTAVVPLVMAAVSILSTMLVVYALTLVTDVSFVVQILVALIGLGVAIDYALLIVVRWREERHHGHDNETAVTIAMTHAGRAVIFSGTTVAIGLFALVVLPVPFLRSVGYGGILIPLVSILVAHTLLPIILATIGPRLDWPHIRREDRAGRFWTGWARLVVRRRWAAIAAGTAILTVLIIPSSRIYPGDPNASSLSAAGPAKSTLIALQHSGIGAGVLTPYEILLHGGQNQADAIARAAATVHGVRAAIAPPDLAWHQASTSVVTALPTQDANGPSGRDTVGRVRAAVHPLTGNPRVGGIAAATKDFVDAVYGSFPLMIALIALVTFILLARAFRSLLLPLKAVVLNAMSVAAAYGVVTLIWQDGHGSRLIWGVDSTGAITSFVPLMVFAFLFGLSMDYEVFILARIREEYDRTGSTRQAVITGLGRTGRLVTSAALILFLAFASLTAGAETEIKVFATGLAAGILIDATIVRALLVPALVSLFNEWNWWLPDNARRVLLLPPTQPADPPPPPQAEPVPSPTA